MTDVGYIQKDKKNAHQGYTYASEKAIKESLHNALVKHGVIFQLSTSDPRVENGVTWINCAYAFHDVESGESVTGIFLGSGSARDEKGHYAAVTGAIKYILTSIFLIPTGDDPENDEGPKKPPKSSRPSSTTNAPYTKPRAFRATGAQIQKIAGLAVSKLGADINDKADILSKINTEMVTDFNSSEDLTLKQAGMIIAHLTAKPDIMAKPE